MSVIVITPSRGGRSRCSADLRCSVHRSRKVKSLADNRPYACDFVFGKDGLQDEWSIRPGCRVSFSFDENDRTWAITVVPPSSPGYRVRRRSGGKGPLMTRITLSEDQVAKIFGVENKASYDFVGTENGRTAVFSPVSTVTHFVPSRSAVNA